MKKTFYTLAFLFLALPFSVFAGDTIIATKTCEPPYVTSVISESLQGNYGLWITTQGDIDFNFIEFPIIKVGNPTGSVYVEMWREDYDTGDLDYILATSLNSYNASDISTDFGVYRFNFEDFLFTNAEGKTSEDYVFLIVTDDYTTPTDAYYLQYGCEQYVPIVHGDINYWYPSGVYDSDYEGAYTTLGYTTEIPCEEHGTLGMFCPPIQNTANAFAGLFSTAIVFTVLNLWPYLLGIIIVFIAYRAGRRILRI